MITYSIHTVMLTTGLSYDQLCRLGHLKEIHGVYENQKVRKYPHGQGGITRFEIAPYWDKTTNKIMGSSFRIIINPSFTADARLISPKEIRSSFKRIFQRISEIVPRDIVENLKISRIDFTGDLQMTTQEQADEYIALMKKGRQIRSLEEKVYYNIVQQDWKSYDESWYLGCRSYDLQVYPKYHQMKNHGLSGAENALGIVRFELRCGRQKIKSIAKKYGINMDISIKDVLTCFAFAAPEPEITNIIKASVGAGDFYTLAELKRLIELSPNQVRTKEKMLNLVQMIARYDSVQDLIDRGLLEASEWRFLLEKFDAIGISPIPIPARFKYETAIGVLEWWI